MRLTRVFVDAPLAPGALLALPDGPAQHLARVLRAKAGDALVVFNGQGGEFTAEIESLQRNGVTVRVGVHATVERESPLETTLLQGIARGEKMDQILQKATELGVTRMVPVLTARSNVRLDADAAARKQRHWQGVVVAACEQCGRNRVPTVLAPVNLAAALTQVASSQRLLLAPDAGARPLRALLKQAPAQAPQSIALLVGPEGGLDPVEIALAAQAGFAACRLGPRVLRTESAALAALAALQALAGDMTGEV
jgi:16S rRNA (uracil1498-N3)-methyltransferase